MPYGLTIYGFCSNSNKQIINRTMHRIARYLAYGSMHEHLRMDNKMEKLEILNIDQLL